MNLTRLPLSVLKKPEKNVRLHSQKQISEFRRSVEMFGQIRPIVCDEQYVILAGNGLYEALVSLGETEADCYVVQGLTEAEKKKLMLADNRIYSLGVDDMQAFDEIIAEINGDFDIPGYDPDLLKTLTIDLSGADDIMAGYGIIGEETKEEMQKATDVYKRENADFTMASERVEPQRPLQRSESVSNGFNEETNVVSSQKINTAETQPEPIPRRYTVCPKCGETIWL